MAEVGQDLRILKLLHSKRKTIHKTKSQPKARGKCLQWSDHKGLISKICKDLMQLNIKKNKIKKPGGGVPGSSEVKNPSANAEYTGSTWHRRIPQPVEQLSLHHSYGACALEPEPPVPSQHAAATEAHLSWSQFSAVRSPCAATREEPTQQWRPSTAKNK